MKFRNDSPYGVVLQAWTTGRVGQQGSITVRVWSTKRYTIKTTPAVRATIAVRDRCSTTPRPVVCRRAQ